MNLAPLNLPKINLARPNPEGMQALSALDASVKALCQAAGLTEGFCHLLRLRASQINGCAFCIRLHARDALAAGESAERVALVSAAQRSQYYIREERAALALLELATSPHQLPQPSEMDLPESWRVAICWTAIIINAWNRYSILNGEVISP